VDVSLGAGQPRAGLEKCLAAQLAEAETVLHGYPDDPIARLVRAQARWGLGKDAEALADLAGLTVPAPLERTVYQYRALAHARLGKADEARKDVEAFRKHCPDLSKRAYLDAAVSVYLGDHDRAFAQLEAVLAKHGDEAGFAQAGAQAHALAAQALAQKQ